MPVADTFFGACGCKQMPAALDLAIVLLFFQARIPPAVADLQVWKNVFRIGHPSYEPASRTKLMDSHIMSVSSDNTGNTRVARLIANAHPHILNLPDPEHHLNNTIKQISACRSLLGLGLTSLSVVRSSISSSQAWQKESFVNFVPS